MTCTSPAEAWVTNSGLTFKPLRGHYSESLPPIHIPCRNCLSCRIDRTREWTTRVLHEAQLHEDNIFVTLTYDDLHLPRDKSLHHSHFQEYIQKLRNYARYSEGKKLRYYMCGEYGEKLGRPHYHAIIFNYRYPDQRPFGKYYGSEKCLEHWGRGHIHIGNVNSKSASYVAGYIQKKVTGERAEEHYRYIDHETGESWMLKPEYNQMSQGIGKKWFQKFGMTDFGTDPENLICHIEGKPYPIPGYYLRILKKTEPEQYESIMQHRKEHAKKNKLDRSELDRKHEARKRTQTKRGKL